MVKYVEKRDGRIAAFNGEKIKEAVLKSFLAVDGIIDDYAETKAENIANYIEVLDKEKIGVEEIQDYVEKGLMSCKRKDVAKAFILFREKRNQVRFYESTEMLDIYEKLYAENVVNQNANVDEYSFGGRRGEASSELNKKIALNIMSPMSRKNHINNEIYVHDLDSYAVGMHNCLTIPYDDLLSKGFNTRQADVRPASSINTAFQLIAVIAQIQSLQQFGGVSASHLDWTMVPYVRKSFRKHFIDGLQFLHNYNDEEYFAHIPIDAGIEDGEYKSWDRAYTYAMKMTERELKQAVEGMYHNLNTLQSRSGNQLPFTSINYGTCTLPEGRMVIKALLEGSLNGVGKLHKTPVFPCGIFQVGEGINKRPGDPNYDLFQLALKSTAKRLYPNYANIDWSVNEGYDKNDPRTYFSTMGL